MKYALLKDLPFAKKDSVFERGSWVGGGWGVDRGTTHYEGGGQSHDGTIVFTHTENALIDSIVVEGSRAWIKPIPTHTQEAFDLYDEGRLSQDELIDFVKAT